MTIEQAIARTEKAISIFEGSLLVNRFEGLKAEIDYYTLVKKGLEKLKDEMCDRKGN